MISPSGMVGASPAKARPASGTTRMARTTTTRNMTPISTVMTFSTTAYRLNHTKSSPSTPQVTPQTLRSTTSGKSAASGRALADIAVAP